MAVDNKVRYCYFNATVTYITHVTELDRFIKTPLYSVNGGGEVRGRLQA